MNQTERFRTYLSDRGFRMTAVRGTVLDGIDALEGHFDADSLYDFLKTRGERISRATIYRTLRLLAETGIVKETGRGREGARYEHVFGHTHHDHMECLRCGKIVEFVSPDIEKLQETVCREHRFTPVEHRLTIQGVCADCGRKRSAGRGTGSGQ